MVGVLATGLLDMVIKQMQKFILKMDSYYMMMQTLEHELSYIDVLLDKNADQATKDNLRSYFADKGLHSIKDIINKAKQDGFDVSKYEHVK